MSENNRRQAWKDALQPGKCNARPRSPINLPLSESDGGPLWYSEQVYGIIGEIRLVFTV